MWRAPIIRPLFIICNELPTRPHFIYRTKPTTNNNGLRTISFLGIVLFTRQNPQIHTILMYNHDGAVRPNHSQHKPISSLPHTAQHINHLLSAFRFIAVSFDLFLTVLAGLFMMINDWAEHISYWSPQHSNQQHDEHHLADCWPIIALDLMASGDIHHRCLDPLASQRLIRKTPTLSINTSLPVLMTRYSTTCYWHTTITIL